MLSVIIPVYNVERYLKQCLDSIINQSYKDLEIIVVNDGSIDESQKIINEFKNKDDRIVCIEQVNKGISAARNAGLSIAKGEYITFLDSDDWIEKDAYKIMLFAMKSENADIVACGVYDNLKNRQTPSLILCDKIIKNIDQEKEKFFLEHALKEASVVWNKIYKKQIIIDNNLSFTDRHLILQEDFLFNYKYYLNINTVVNLSDLFIHYRVRKSSVTKKKIANMTEYNLRLIAYMKNYQDERGYCNQLDNYIAKKAYSLFNISTYNTQHNSFIEIKKEIIKFNENEFYRKSIPSKVDSFSLKNIIQYITDIFVYFKFFNLATLIQWVRVKIHTKNQIDDLNSYYE